MVEPYPSEKYEFVSWNNDIPNWMGKIMFQTTNQKYDIGEVSSIYLLPTFLYWVVQNMFSTFFWCIKSQYTVTSMTKHSPKTNESISVEPRSAVEWHYRHRGRSPTRPFGRRPPNDGTPIPILLPYTIRTRNRNSMQKWWELGPIIGGPWDPKFYGNVLAPRGDSCIVCHQFWEACWPELSTVILVR